jgi:hypothetical protein
MKNTGDNMAKSGIFSVMGKFAPNLLTEDCLNNKTLISTTWRINQTFYLTIKNSWFRDNNTKKISERISASH